MDRNYVDEPTLSPVKIVRDPTGKPRVLVGDVPAEDAGEVMYEGGMLYPRTPEQARARLARRVERYEATGQ